jgi:hypothetical protein
LTVESYFWTVAAVAEHDDYCFFFFVFLDSGAVAEHDDYVFFSFFFWTVAAVAEHDDHAHHH